MRDASRQDQVAEAERAIDRLDDVEQRQQIEVLRGQAAARLHVLRSESMVAEAGRPSSSEEPQELVFAKQSRPIPFGPIELPSPTLDIGRRPMADDTHVGSPGEVATDDAARRRHRAPGPVERQRLQTADEGDDPVLEPRHPRHRVLISCRPLSPCRAPPASSPPCAACWVPAPSVLCLPKGSASARP